MYLQCENETALEKIQDLNSFSKFWKHLTFHFRYIYCNSVTVEVSSKFICYPKYVLPFRLQVADFVKLNWKQACASK